MRFMEDITTISITKKTKLKLAEYGKFGDSYDDILNQLISKVSEA